MKSFHKKKQVDHLAVPFGSEVETCSAPLTGTFTTRPLAPTTFRVDEELMEVAWVASPSPSVSTYKVRWKSTEEGSKPEELLIPAPEDPNNCRLALKVDFLSVYEVDEQSCSGLDTRDPVQSEHLCHCGGLWDPSRVEGIARQSKSHWASTKSQPA